MDSIDTFSAYRPLLWALSVVGFFGVNGVFLYCVLWRPATLEAALQNPISVVFIVEALLLTAFFAWGVRFANIENPGWGVFIVLSVVGSLAFSVPAFLLLHLHKADGTRRAGPA